MLLLWWFLIIDVLERVSLSLCNSLNWWHNSCFKLSSVFPSSPHPTPLPTLCVISSLYMHILSVRYALLSSSQDGPAHPLKTTCSPWRAEALSLSLSFSFYFCFLSLSLSLLFFLTDRTKHTSHRQMPSNLKHFSRYGSNVVFRGKKI